MKALAIVTLAAFMLALVPSTAFAQRFGGHGGGAPAARPHPAAPAGGFNFHNDAVPGNRLPPPAPRPAPPRPAPPRPAPPRPAPQPPRNPVNVNNHTTVVNRNVNVNVNRGVVVNPVYRGGAAWGWNHGSVWVVRTGYWGGGFWGALAIGVTSAVVAGAVMGSIVNAQNNVTYTSYQVQPNSPGATLLSNYHLQQVPCGPPGLVIIYGPQNGVICAAPNSLVAAGTYTIDTSTLSLTSQF